MENLDLGLDFYLEKFDLTTENSLLLVIDIQDKMSVAMKDESIFKKNAAILVESATKLDIPVLFTEQYPKGLGPTSPELLSKANNPFIAEKSGFDALTDEIKSRLTPHRYNIIICGIETHICVFQTARSLLKAGFNVIAATDAMSSRTSENKEIGLNMMISMGAVISSTETILFDWLKTSKHEKFKEIQALIK